MTTAYIVKAYRTAVGKANKGGFRFTRPDDLAADVIKYMLAEVPQLDQTLIDDVIVGNAMPEAEQGLNVGRFISLMGLDNNKVPGMTVNRYCSSGIETMAIAKSKIEAGIADIIIAGGTESMSAIAMGGWRVVPNAKVSKEHADWYWGMGNTAEEVAAKYHITREMQDEFAYHSHMKSLKAIKEGKFKDQIVPISVNEVYLDKNGKRAERVNIVDTDEGPRFGTSVEALARLRPVFQNGGTVTAGNSSQMSDGAAFVLMMSEEMVKKFDLEPIARLVSYKVVGVPPRIMGVGPVEAIPGAIKMAGLKQNDIDLFELNEAFASQSLAVIKEVGLNPDIVNVNGGAISLGHPLGCTGAKLSVQVMSELKKRKQKYGVVTMCVGTGQGAAGVIEMM
ncbi:acetyl-CoA C-acyltransferase [Putridiphycobacter roseus]|uniref:acetyl-CoA C-acyltransferase n=1 Tax=Putridiphycobacter roseus TaxID=2219161 RepID=A0A2W1NRF0_9FLAO|nr:acetyl-CoA C-acyltransferase [Putridiphycobacter roseus]PZE18202.1 acetyl-CoA C-acyltransferase [Putridiphycobacter roseus]